MILGKAKRNIFRISILLVFFVKCPYACSKLYIRGGYFKTSSWIFLVNIAFHNKRFLHTFGMAHFETRTLNKFTAVMIFGRNFPPFFQVLLWVSTFCVPDCSCHRGNSLLLYKDVAKCVTGLPVWASLTFNVRKIPGSLLFTLQKGRNVVLATVSKCSKA